MKFYIASKVKHAARWRAFRTLAVECSGAQLVSTWIDEAGEGETKCYSELSTRCIEEIRQSDFLIIYSEPGEILKGVNVEFGAALAFGKPVRCVGWCETIPKIFQAHPLFSFFGSVLEAIKYEK